MRNQLDWSCWPDLAISTPDRGSRAARRGLARAPDLKPGVHPAALIGAALISSRMVRRRKKYGPT